MIYPVTDLAAAKSSATRMLGVEPYFDEPFYVGYTVGGYEFALDPNANPGDGAMTYWGVANIDSAVDELLSAGARLRTGIDEVGDRIRVATLDVSHVGALGIIQNPHFESHAIVSSGPGR